ncbi:hypothetical protein I3842_14G012800 [Carya illinoinensis]|uniref:WAT1-related protein n=1 Tax=Carya illinoinensis TaxID=32201 RepID=A0A922DCC2_CARIL|nr:hypothetical protein I3842_14G012800 [Carya illinoinensis]
MEKRGCCGGFLEASKPYFAMISLQFGYSVMNILGKVSLNGGMSHYVLVAYCHAFATAVIAPFAFIFERKEQPRITFPVFVQIFVLALLGVILFVFDGPVIDQNFYYAGLKYTSPTFSYAISNMLPAMTFVMAVIFRMEKLSLKKVGGQAKLVGTAVTVAGAMLMTLYKGPLVKMVWSKHIHPPKSYGKSSSGNSDKDWFKGSILIITTLAWSGLFVLQTHALKTYKNHQLSLTSLMCFHKTSVWKIGFGMNLLAAAYAGIVTSSISYFVQGLVIKKKGPVFATAFSPLLMIIVAILGSFILAEKIFLGGVLGSILIVMGLYSVLWGKHKESMENKAALEEEIPDAIKVAQVSGEAVLIIGDIEANEIQMGKGSDDRELAATNK